MQLVTFLDQNQNEQVGILVESHNIIDAQAGLEWLKTVQSPSHLDMLTVIRKQNQILPAFHSLIAAYQEKKLPSSLIKPASNLHLLSPIPRPVSMRDGYAFRQHVEAARRNRGLAMIPEFDLFPVFYFTNHLAVTGPGKLSIQELALKKLDYELEVAIVIGKEGRNIPADQADSYIFGYMIMNDWSARELQMEEMKLNLGPAKGKDFATSLGPVLVTSDELEKYEAKGSSVGKRHDLQMKAFINGKQFSSGNLKDMNWSFAQIIERASYGVTLYPGEVIGSGTVGTGCLLELNGSKITDNLWLKPGDQVVLEVEGLGRLENQIAAAGV